MLALNEVTTSYVAHYDGDLSEDDQVEHNNRLAALLPTLTAAVCGGPDQVQDLLEAAEINWIFSSEHINVSESLLRARPEHMSVGMDDAIARFFDLCEDSVWKRDIMGYLM